MFPLPHNRPSLRRQYELTGKLLGVGGFALVYEAVCTKDAAWGDSRWTFRVAKGQRVAAKVMTTRRVDVGCIREYVKSVGCHRRHRLGLVTCHSPSID